jgi:hypothetical protein
MKELGGVGAVVLGGMILLTVKVGPPERGPLGPPAERAPGGAMAALAGPAAEPVAPVETRACTVTSHLQGEREKAEPRPERPDAFRLVVKTVEGAFTVSVPREVTRL